jgi:hypothetical protein
MGRIACDRHRLLFIERTACRDPTPSGNSEDDEHIYFVRTGLILVFFSSFIARCDFEYNARDGQLPFAPDALGSHTKTPQQF